MAKTLDTLMSRVTLHLTPDQARLLYNVLDAQLPEWREAVKDPSATYSPGDYQAMLYDLESIRDQIKRTMG
jgi:hypothetical protein